MESVYQRLIAPGANAYAGMLGFAFRGSGRGGAPRRIVLVLLPFALLVFTFKAVPPVIGTEAMPPMDTGNVRVHVRFGANEPVTVAEARLKAFEEKLMQDQRVQRVSAIFGSEPGVLSLGSGQSPAEATLNISYVTRFERAATSWQIEADLRRQIAALPGVTVADAFDSGTTALSTVKAPVDLRLSADDWRLLPEAADKVRAALGTVPGLTSVSPTWDGYTTEARLVLDEAKLRAYGLTPETVFNQLPLKGAAASSLSKLPAAGAVPVRAYFAEPWRSDPAALALLPIVLADGHTVSLGEVGHIVQQPGLNLLTGSQLRYTVDLLAYRETLPISLLSERAQAAAREVLPPGVSLEEKTRATTMPAAIPPSACATAWWWGCYYLWASWSRPMAAWPWPCSRC